MAVARALILQPPLVLADEPTGNLDRRIAKDIGELLIRMTAERKAILIAVTHSAELAEAFPAVRQMDGGRLV